MRFVNPEKWCWSLCRVKAWPAVLVTLLLVAGPAPRLLAAENSVRPVDRLVLVTLDGVRCEELFGGMDAGVLRQFAKERKLEQLTDYKNFWAKDAATRRLRLMPFFWGTLMKEHGSVIGNSKLGSEVHLKNRWRVSYPGYSELVTGQAQDKVIKNNNKVYNPKPTVFEALKGHLQVPAKRVAVFASWQVMHYIVQQEAGAVFTNSGFETYRSEDPFIQTLSRMQFETLTPWDSVRSDAYTFRFAMDYLEREQPAVLYLALGETDDWAHEKRYDRVLAAIHQADRYLRQLWEWLQASPEYAGRTLMLITTDHGRGRTPFNWQHHNDKLQGARSTWVAVAGPGMTKRGEWSHHRRVYAREVASTLARAVGLDFRAVQPGAAGPIEFLFETR